MIWANMEVPNNGTQKGSPNDPLGVPIKGPKMEPKMGREMGSFLVPVLGGA